jgi:hypothetical protein
MIKRSCDITDRSGYAARPRRGTATKAVRPRTTYFVKLVRPITWNMPRDRQRRLQKLLAVCEERDQPLRFPMPPLRFFTSTFARF